MQKAARIIYTCIASNEAGSAEQHYHIRPLGMFLLMLYVRMNSLGIEENKHILDGVLIAFLLIL